MEAAGGNANAMTYYDFTAYVDDLPPQEIALAAQLEADRMVNLDLRKRQVETERDVVVEERLSAVEDSVDGTLDELLYKQAFKSHPYRWPVIGWMKDIKAITHDKALAFYRRFYAPNNAVLVIAGNFEPAATLDADRRATTARSRRRRPRNRTTCSPNAPRPRRCASRSPARCPPTAGDRLSGAGARRSPTAPPTRWRSRSSPAAPRRACTGR